jgi:HEAT repeat protein
VNRYWPRAIGLCCLLLSGAGCATFWDEILSHECDWSVATGIGKKDPLVVIRDNADHVPNADGARRAEAISQLREPLQVGGNAKDQQLYLEILTVAAKQDSEPLCRLAAVRTLGRFRDPRAARVLEEVYQLPVRRANVKDDGNVLFFTHENNSMIRKEALVALEKSHDPEARHLLIRVARQPGPPPSADLADRLQTQDEKMEAIRALGKYRDAECIDALKYVLRSEKDIALRYRAIQSLEESTGKRWPTPIEAWQQDDVRPLPGDPNPDIIQRVGAWLPKL